MLLHLGVDPEDVAYAEAGVTVGDVAQILEDKFHVMQIFADQNEDKIALFIEDGVAGALESVLSGAPERFDVFGSAMENIKGRFHEYIDGSEHGIKLKKMDAPKAGSRKKRQYRKVTHTLAFYDTGRYEGNFKAWIE